MRPLHVAPFLGIALLGGSILFMSFVSSAKATRAAERSVTPETVPLASGDSTEGGSAAARDSTKADSTATKKWDVAHPPGPRETLEFDAEEGTWISVDVHPKGHLLVFDLLGDIYTLPIAGGEAKLISGGIPYEIQPRFSPDGSRILFTSDRGGGENIWVMNADGTEPTAITQESYRLLNNAAWHPSGQYVVAKKHFTSARSMGAGEMWMYKTPEGGIPDGGDGVQLTERKNDQQDVGEPECSPDGRFLYWSEDMSPGPYFQYNKDPNGIIYMVRRLDLESGEISNVIEVPGGAVRPQVSPDGKQLAFIRRVRARSVLCLFDLASRQIRELWDGLDEDQQETWSLFGVHPGFDWTPDGQALVISARGKLWRVDARNGGASAIPFRAKVNISVANPVRFAQKVGEAQFPVRVIRHPVETADGTMIFQALGVLYRLGRGESVPQRLTRSQDEIETAPQLSPDGRSLVYVSWNDARGGRVKVCDVRGGSPRTLVEVPGHYLSASWSPSGREVVYERGGGDRYRGRLWSDESGIYIIEASGKATPRLVCREGTRPRFNRLGTRIFLQTREGSGDAEKTALISLNLGGGDRHVHAKAAHATDFVLSPDEKYLAFEELWESYVTPFPLSARTIEVGPESKALPVRKLSRGGGTFLSWSSDSKRVSWSQGPEVFSANLADLYAKKDSTTAAREKAEREKAPYRGAASAVRKIEWQAPADVPASDYWLVGAKVLPMDDLSSIPDAAIHVQGNRLSFVGPRGASTPPPGATVVDVTGKTIMPGLVDIHAHTGASEGGLHSQQNWAFLAQLAFGVTTTHDPSNDTQSIFAESERVKAGTMLGPRIFSTGTILYGAEGDFKTVIKTQEDALDAVHRQASWGAFTVKSYNQPRREQRQMVIEAGRQLGVMVVPEGGSTLHNNMTHLIDGHTTLEHAIPVSPLYDPELRLLSRFGSGYTPTLVVGYGGIWGENYWYHHTEVWKNERLLRFVPRSIVDPRSRRRVMAPEEEYHHFSLARTVAEVVRRGGNVQLGAHGQLQGLAAHWELWMFAQGGMSNHEALRAGSWMGARALGLDGDLGSLREGKLADLLVIDGDPLADLSQSENILYTMINGRLFEARTLEQILPNRKPAPTLPDIEGVEATATCACTGGAAHAH